MPQKDKLSPNFSNLKQIRIKGLKQIKINGI